MTILPAIAVSALVGAAASMITKRVIRNSFTEAIGGSRGADPIAEHRRKLSEANQRESKIADGVELLELSLDALPSGIIITDDQGNVILRNRLADDVVARAHERTLVDGTTTELLAAAAQRHSVER